MEGADKGGDQVDKLAKRLEENMVVSIAKRKWTKSKEAFNRALVVKLATGDTFSFNTVSGILKKAWEAKDEDVLFEEIAGNMMVAKFKEVKKLEEVMEGGPWTYQNQLIVVKRWVVGMKPECLDFNKVQFWVQLHNIPQEYMDEEITLDLAESIGRVVKVKQEEKGVRKKRFARHINDPICRGMYMNLLDGEEEPIWVDVKYERLPVICEICNAISHKTESCPRSGVASQEVVVVNGEGGGDQEADVTRNVSMEAMSLLNDNGDNEVNSLYLYKSGEVAGRTTRAEVGQRMNQSSRLPVEGMEVEGTPMAVVAASKRPQLLAPDPKMQPSSWKPAMTINVESNCWRGEVGEVDASGINEGTAKNSNIMMVQADERVGLAICTDGPIIRGAGCGLDQISSEVWRAKKEGLKSLKEVTNDWSQIGRKYLKKRDKLPVKRFHPYSAKQGCVKEGETSIGEVCGDDLGVSVKNSLEAAEVARQPRRQV